MHYTLSVNRKACTATAQADRRDQLPRLARIEIKNLATISDLSLELGYGFCAFTGETGAGKSIIVDALGLLIGSRGNNELIRTGERDLLVTGFWENDQSVSRKLSAQGRGTARMDGEVVSLRELQEHMSKQLTIHWQHSATTLLSAANQRALLDQQIPQAVQAFTQAYYAWQKTTHKLEQLQKGQQERARMLDLLSYQIAEIQAVAPKPEEEEPLNTELIRLANLQQITESAAGSLELLSEGDVNAIGLLSNAVKTLQIGAKYDEATAQLQNELRETVEAVQAIASELRTKAEDNAADPEALDQTEARLSALNKLKSKYGPSLEEVLAFEQKIATELEQLQADEQDIGTLDAEVEMLFNQMHQQGQILEQARQNVADPLAQQLLSVIQKLGMPHARLEFQFRPLEQACAYGLSDVSIMFSANPGEDLAPLADAASGGELSRVMLAISTILGAETPSVIFDEVDAGIGGAAAHAVADQLKNLAKDKQVMVVTHLAQIAAKANHHYRVEKRVQNGRTVTQVRLLDQRERLDEIARMLSGNTSKAALQHAWELLNT